VPLATAIDQAIAGRVAKARSAKRFTKSYVAGELGISYQAYKKLEDGNTAFTVHRLMRIADLLGTELNQLIP